MKQATRKWEFKSRFRRHAFGWKSQPAITRIKQAVVEIRKVPKVNLALAADGAIAFLERLSPALENIDSSSGAIGTAVNDTIAELVPVIASAPANAETRETWLERLWEAYQNDEIPYVERLGDRWGELCASDEVASAWADRLQGIVRQAWNPDPRLCGFLQGHSELSECSRRGQTLRRRPRPARDGSIASWAARIAEQVGTDTGISPSIWKGTVTLKDWGTVADGDRVGVVRALRRIRGVSKVRT